MSNLPNTFATALVVEPDSEQEEASLINSDPSFNLTDKQVASLSDEIDQTGKQVEQPINKGIPSIKVKAPIAAAPTPAQEKYMTASQFVKQAQEMDVNLLAGAIKTKFAPEQVAQVIPKSKAPIKKDKVIDYSTLTETDIYNDSIPIDVKPFGMEDSLTINLKDKNYVPRWINKNAIMLGKALKNGFTYVTAEDLETPLDVAISEDAQGRFLNYDVIAMKCLKRIYFGALKAAHMRAVNTVSALSSQKAARKQAMDLLSKETGGGFAEEYEAGKIAFYTPGIEI